MEKYDWIKRIFGFLRLSHEREENQLIHETIESGIVFRGTNLWILIFASFIASVGLNMNSTAVVIGAMLISPLMGPITGIGYSVATYDLDLFKKSIKNYGFSVIAGLVASTLYFALSPIHTEHSELLARTSPSIYDVFIALFGGLAGIVAISSKNKGNVIPGVAIATALMPPLCTAGFGIAIGNLSYFFGAMYLFLINSVFIALSAMLVSQFLKLPKRSFLLSREIKNTKILVVMVISLTVIPSLYFGYSLVRKEKFINLSNKFISQIDDWEGNYLMNEHINGDLRSITLVYVGNEIDSKSHQRLLNKAHKFGLTDVDLKIKQGLPSELIQSDQNNKMQLKRMNNEVISLRESLKLNTSKLDSISQKSSLGQELLLEISTLFPEISGCSYSETRNFSLQPNSSDVIPVVIFTTEKPISKTSESNIQHWLEEKLKVSQVILTFRRR